MPPDRSVRSLSVSETKFPLHPSATHGFEDSMTITETSYNFSPLGSLEGLHIYNEDLWVYPGSASLIPRGHYTPLSSTLTSAQTYLFLRRLALPSTSSCSHCKTCAIRICDHIQVHNCSDWFLKLKLKGNKYLALKRPSWTKQIIKNDFSRNIEREGTRDIVPAPGSICHLSQSTLLPENWEEACPTHPISGWALIERWIIQMPKCNPWTCLLLYTVLWASWTAIWASDPRRDAGSVNLLFTNKHRCYWSSLSPGVS